MTRTMQSRKTGAACRHDSLTGLPTGLLFAEHMEHALSAVRRDKARLALMFVDIDSFKPVNDTLGHAIGDLLLKEIASRIQNALRESDIAAQMAATNLLSFCAIFNTTMMH